MQTSTPFMRMDDTSGSAIAPTLETITYNPFLSDLEPIEMNVWRGSQVALLT
ncbi:MAG: hypothetical protein MUF49_16735 [Oculatellaceae cyanobacterium Prado106]|jgi:hypothetical protein|nr:hypothetical protein [Oculatellaceae cyanobacterium Prado106]